MVGDDVCDCVVQSTRLTKPRSRKILRSPANKDVLGILEGYVTEFADPTAVLPQSTWKFAIDRQL